MNDPIRTFQVENLDVQVYPDRTSLGSTAAAAVSARIQKLQRKQASIRMVFAAAPSQNEFLAALCEDDGIDWSQITGFHMDEYLGLPASAPQLFGNFLRERIFTKVPFGAVHYIDPEAESAEQECRRYAELINRAPVDIVCMGIGENGHIAFNDPPVADFNDPATVKIVTLDQPCRQQQVNDGCFAEISQVPKQALTLTVPALMSADFITVVVPGPTKKEAVKRTLTGSVETACPASILRRHHQATLYLDADSAVLLEEDAKND